MRSVHCFLIALSAALSACGAEGAAGVDPGSPSPSATATPLIDEPVVPLCPQGLGTRYMARQGRSLLGSRAQSFTVREVRIGCSPVADLKLDGTTLRGTVNGKAVSGQDFVGATVVQSDESGAAAEARIDAIEPDAQDASGETLLYTLSYKDAATGASVGACVADKSGTAKAIPVQGAWDSSGAHILSPSEFTFGCTSGVVAKCVRWGYKPWQSKGSTPLGPYHEACVRMARADYCGRRAGGVPVGSAVARARAPTTRPARCAGPAPSHRRPERHLRPPAWRATPAACGRVSLRPRRAA